MLKGPPAWTWKGGGGASIVRTCQALCCFGRGRHVLAHATPAGHSQRAVHARPSQCTSHLQATQPPNHPPVGSITRPPASSRTSTPAHRSQQPPSPSSKKASSLRSTARKKDTACDGGGSRVGSPTHPPPPTHTHTHTHTPTHPHHTTTPQHSKGGREMLGWAVRQAGLPAKSIRMACTAAPPLHACPADAQRTLACCSARRPPALPCPTKPPPACRCPPPDAPALCHRAEIEGARARAAQAAGRLSQRADAVEAGVHEAVVAPRAHLRADLEQPGQGGAVPVKPPPRARGAPLPHAFSHNPRCVHML